MMDGFAIWKEPRGTSVCVGSQFNSQNPKSGVEIPPTIHPHTHGGSRSVVLPHPTFLFDLRRDTLHAHAHLRSILLERSRIYRTSTHHDISLGIRNAFVCLFLCLCPVVSVSHLLLLLLSFDSFSARSTVVVATINNNHVRRSPNPQGQTNSKLR